MARQPRAQVAVMQLEWFRTLSTRARAPLTTPAAFPNTQARKPSWNDRVLRKPEAATSATGLRAGKAAATDRPRIGLTLGRLRRVEEAS